MKHSKNLWTMLFCLGFAGLLQANSPKEHFDRQTLKNTMKKVTDWQINHFSYQATGSAGQLHDSGINAWTNAVLYIGMSRWAEVSGNPDINLWLKNIGEKSNWEISSNFSRSTYGLFHADELCAGQFYLDMYSRYGDTKMLESAKSRLDWIISHQPDTSLSAKNKQSWSWCDALFMAPPIFARMSCLLQDDVYIKYMDKQFKRTFQYLYDPEEHLFFRDDSYFPKRETNGRKIFWGRGNGWVAAGLVNILRCLPSDSQVRPFYEDLFREFVPNLASFQDSSGFWHASLLDPDAYPSPETSATALITYAIAYGVNNGLLEKTTFRPQLVLAWKALSGAINKTGKLGWIQPIGADPRMVTKKMTAVYGVGATLLAVSELYQLTELTQQ
jgi:rhamnogalacturonyl hydrolase YesR